MYGYSCEGVGAASLHYTNSGDIVYFTAAVGVVYTRHTNTQVQLVD